MFKIYYDLSCLVIIMTIYLDLSFFLCIVKGTEQKVKKDLLDIWAYIPAGMAAGMAAVLISLVKSRAGRQMVQRKKVGAIFLCFFLIK